MSYNQYNNTNHFYPRSPQGERPWHIHGFLRGLPISIHALRKESDFYIILQRTHTVNISIHALRKESDGKGSRRCVLSGISIHALRKESDAAWSRPCAR